MACSCCKRDVKIKAKELCSACYQRLIKTGSTEYKRKGKINYCHIKGCGDRVVSHGLCDKHRSRLRRHGHTDNTRPEYWGAKAKHPMFHSWSWMKRHKSTDAVCDEWLNDFFQFVMDVGERPSKNHKLFRADDSKPYGKDNFVWKESVTQRVDGEDERTYTNRKARVYRALRKEGYKDNEMKSKYGISLAKYNEMLELQDGVCKICKKEETAKSRNSSKSRGLAIDHCHETGQVRGLLCTKCNTALGGFKDDPNLLKKAIEYLNEFS
jgi:hypothetical protein